MKVAKKIEELIDSNGKKKFQLPDGNWVDGSFDIERGSVVWDTERQTYMLIYGLSGGNWISCNAWARPIEYYPPLGAYFTDGRPLSPGFFNSYCMNSSKRGYRVIEGPILKKVEELLQQVEKANIEKAAKNAQLMREAAKRGDSECIIIP